jgi:beta-lactam-binding protein with PASTA domain/tRNA A-37 threonylcarbamoyl transferase component Bud32
MSDPQQTYGDRYAVMEKVGSGGMAEVYRARDQLLGREVALKVLSRRLSSDRSFVERFRREAQAAANLNHPNIVSLYDYGAEDGNYYIVMEFIEGRSLEETIHAGRVMPERAAEIAAEVARALERAHLAGLVHRDIKPANVMITEAGAVKVTDFGIVRALAGNGEQTVTQTGMVIGTAAYLSPEQAQGHPVDGRSDVYSLGVVLFEMLTGETPFSGESPLSVAYKHVRENPVPPSALNPDLPDALDAIVMKALAKNPDNRYSSALEMREDLERYLSGQAVTATPILPADTMVEPTDTGGGTQVLAAQESYYEEPQRRSRAWIPVLLVLLLLAAAAVVAFLFSSDILAPKVHVPKVVGETQTQAIADLKKAGLGYNVSKQPNGHKKGEVFKQDPAANSTVSKGGNVTIFVSTGPNPVAVPDLTRLTLGEAKTKLRNAHLKLGTVADKPSDSVDKGLVIDQSLPSGIQTKPGTPVDVTVSTGPASVTVPDVTGETQSQAQTSIEGAGLTAAFTNGPSDTVPAGEAIAQDPSGGSTATRGDTVTVTISTGPQAQSMPDVRNENADTAESQLRNNFGLNVVRQDGTCAQPPGTVCDQSPKPGTKVQNGDTATLFVMPTGGASPSSTGTLPLGGLLKLLLGG